MPSKKPESPVRVRPKDKKCIALFSKRHGWAKTEVITRALAALAISLEQRKERR